MDDDEHLRLLISAKAVIYHDGAIVLVRNKRDEWDLPGGKLQHGESIEEALARELGEELAVELLSWKLLSADRHHFYTDILVLVYACEVNGIDNVQLSEEHLEVRSFPIEQLPLERIPAPYHAPIRAWIAPLT